jgi:hypothetical protein
MRPGASLTFQVEFFVHGDASGTIDSSVEVSGNTKNFERGPSVAGQLTVHDTRGGAYRLYAGDGGIRDAEVDFAKAQLVLHGAGSDVMLPFHAVSDGFATGATYATSDSARFRTPRDLLWARSTPASGCCPSSRRATS